MKKYISIIFAQVLAANLFSQGTNTPCTSGSPAATVLTPGATCTYSAGTTAGQTYQSNANNGGTPSCASPGAADVWFMFTAPAGGDVTIDLGSGTITDSGMSLYSGSCGAFTEITCNDDGGTGTMSQITATGLTAGQTYFIRVWDFDGIDGTFTICVQDNSSSGSAPANDDPCNATTIAVGASCSFSTYTNENATSTTGVADPSCANYAGGDVWFQITVPAAGALTFDSNTGVILDGGMAIYSGTCGALTEISCDDDGSLNGAMSLIADNTLTPGATIWIRMWEYGNDNNGTFDLCVYENTPPPPPPGNVTCGGMEPICSDTPITFTASTGGTDADIANPGNDYGCLFTSPNPTWYYLELAAGGVISIDMSAGSDIDFALWGPYADLATAQADCNSYPAPFDCSYSTSPTEQANVPSAIAGEVYVLLVTNYADVTQVIDLNSASGNTALTDCSIILPIELLSFSVTAEYASNTLRWTTLSEIANDFFTVERSTDGIHFNTIGTVDASGNSSTELQYEYIDRDYTADLTYYRLKQIDYDGTISYSAIVSANRKTDVISVYPNPSSGELTFQFPVSCHGSYHLTFKDSMGKEYLEYMDVNEETHATGSALFEHLPAGIYFVEILDDNGNLVSLQKIIKIR
ncbi:MAG: T9SS type A sorting domain-containing protein [Bacteroidetes bacterium]|nr:T9SS type A sorting domain-containing protein [Bacteroidota bacterium]